MPGMNAPIGQCSTTAFTPCLTLREGLPLVLLETIASALQIVCKDNRRTRNINLKILGQKHKNTLSNSVIVNQ